MQKRRNNKNTLAAELIPRGESARDSGIKNTITLCQRHENLESSIPLSVQ